jgi:hypothetical protein
VSQGRLQIIDEPMATNCAVPVLHFKVLTPPNDLANVFFWCACLRTPRRFPGILARSYSFPETRRVANSAGQQQGRLTQGWSHKLLVVGVGDPVVSFITHHVPFVSWKLRQGFRFTAILFLFYVLLSALSISAKISISRSTPYKTDQFGHPPTWEGNRASKDESLL